MAQGKHKLGKAKRSSGAKRKAVKVSKSAKKGSAHLENNKQTIETSKAINRKNERIVAAKACNAGSTNFFLKDIVDKGSKELKRQTALRNKKQDNASKLTGRLQDKLQKLK